MTANDSEKKIEVRVNFMRPGAVLKGDAYTASGEKINDGGKPFSEEMISKLQQSGIDLIYYNPPVFSGKTTGKNMMIADKSIKNAVTIVLDLENIVNTKSALPVKEINDVIEDMIGQMTLQEGTVLNLLDIKNYDDYTYTHSINVSLLSLMIGKILKLPEETLMIIGVSGMLHDIGKVMVPIEITNKPGKLTPDEMEVMKKHPLYGYEIIKRSSNLDKTLQEAVLFHHEKTDGSGYLYGKKGEEMGVLAQIVSIADVFDAITSKRSYKKNLPFWAALIHIQNEISKSFIPRLAQTFINNAHVFLSEQDIFPIGSIVTLNTGEIAEIAAQSQEQTLSPLIDIFLDSKQEPLRKPVRVDLALGDDRSIEKLIESPELITKLREIKKLHS